MPVVISGTAGITTPGMESSAMPTVGGDAVVESGSNSDGEWTRWADGTQICRKGVAELPYTSGALTSQVEQWAYPAVFVPGEAVAKGVDGYPTTSTGARLHAFLRSGNGGTDTYARVDLVNTQGAAVTRILQYSCIAHGRWK